MCTRLLRTSKTGPSRLQPTTLFFISFLLYDHIYVVIPTLIHTFLCGEKLLVFGSFDRWTSEVKEDGIGRRKRRVENQGQTPGPGWVYDCTEDGSVEILFLRSRDSWGSDGNWDHRSSGNTKRYEEWKSHKVWSLLVSTESGMDLKTCGLKTDKDRWL